MIFTSARPSGKLLVISKLIIYLCLLGALLSQRSAWILFTSVERMRSAFPLVFYSLRAEVHYLAHTRDTLPVMFQRYIFQLDTIFGELMPSIDGFLHRANVTFPSILPLIHQAQDGVDSIVSEGITATLYPNIARQTLQEVAPPDHTVAHEAISTTPKLFRLRPTSYQAASQSSMNYESSFRKSRPASYSGRTTQWGGLKTLNLPLKVANPSPQSFDPSSFLLDRTHFRSASTISISTSSSIDHRRSTSVQLFQAHERTSLLARIQEVEASRAESDRKNEELGEIVQILIAERDQLLGDGKGETESMRWMSTDIGAGIIQAYPSPPKSPVALPRIDEVSPPPPTSSVTRSSSHRYGVLGISGAD